LFDAQPATTRQAGSFAPEEKSSEFFGIGIEKKKKIALN
jgi:hypothetical protein